MGWPITITTRKGNPSWALIFAQGCILGSELFINVLCLCDYPCFLSSPSLLLFLSFLFPSLLLSTFPYTPTPIPHLTPLHTHILTMTGARVTTVVLFLIAGGLIMTTSRFRSSSQENLIALDLIDLLNQEQTNLSANPKSYNYCQAPRPTLETYPAPKVFGLQTSWLKLPKFLFL